MEMLNELLEIIEEEELNEAKRAFKKTRDGKIVKSFRCTSGKRKGKLVNDVSICFKKKDIKRARKARITTKRTRFVRSRKSKITKRKAMSKLVTRLNRKTSKRR